MLRHRSPNFLTVDDKVVAILDRTRLHRRQVTARARLRISLAPDLLAFEDARDVMLLLLLGPPMHQGRAEQTDSHPDERLVESEPAQLFAKDQPLHDGRAAATVFLGPVDRDPAPFIELLVPIDARLPISCALLRHDIARRRREPLIGLEPRSHLSAKRFIFRAEIKIHFLSFHTETSSGSLYRSKQSCHLELRPVEPAPQSRLKPSFREARALRSRIGPEGRFAIQVRLPRRSVA